MEHFLWAICVLSKKPLLCRKEHTLQSFFSQEMRSCRKWGEPEINCSMYSFFTSDLKGKPRMLSSFLVRLSVTLWHPLFMSRSLCHRLALTPSRQDKAVTLKQARKNVVTLSGREMMCYFTLLSTSSKNVKKWNRKTSKRFSRCIYIFSHFWLHHRNSFETM